MSVESFEKFKEDYLKRFKKYYKESESRNQRSELKRSIYENNNLSNDQKDEFWSLIVIGRWVKE